MIKKQKKDYDGMQQEINSLREEMKNKIAIFDNFKQSVYEEHLNYRLQIL